MNHSSDLGGNKQRDDIQGLRAIAVALVLLFHFGEIIEGGYLGVDMFFVISGFVIAQSTIREIHETSTFSWRNFLRRRVRRLLPGAIVVLVFSSFAALIFLSPFGPQQETSRMVVGAATYSTNFLLMSSGYFVIKAESNPLLHFWSLAVEEQFYFVWPFIIMFLISLRRRCNYVVFRASIFIALFSTIAVSCLLYFLFLEKSSLIDHFSMFDYLEQRNITLENFGFYSPFSRAWEFLAGVLSAVLLMKSKKPTHHGWQRFTWIVGGISVAFSVAVIEIMDTSTSATENSSHALPTILCVLGTASLLFSGENLRLSQRALGISGLRKVGDWSYSIYLWHWPFWAFAARIWNPGWGLTVLITAVSVGTGALQYIMFENPVRRNKMWRRIPSVGLVASVVTGSIVIAVCYSRLTPQIALRISGRTTGELALHIIEIPCSGKSISLGNADSCVYTNAESDRTVILVGDSMAKSLSDGFTSAAQELGMRSLVYSSPGCPYLYEGSPTVANDACSAWRSNVFNIISSVHPNILVIANLNSLYVELIGQATSPQNAELNWSEELDKTLKNLTAVVDSILIVQPPPKFLKDVTYDISLFKSIGLDENRSDVIARRYAANMIETDTVGTNSPLVQIYNFDDIFCGEKTCSQMVNGQLMFEDVNHLTPQGSLLLVDPLKERFRKLIGL
jgi:peptidoglycan/LPS O-acetylase OafA/YrhL